MKMNAYVAGVGMVPFGKHLDKTLKGLAGQAIQLALNDAGLDKTQLQAAWMGNAAAGVVTGQEMIRGEVVLRGMGIGKIPVVNVENKPDDALYLGTDYDGRGERLQGKQPYSLTFAADQLPPAEAFWSISAYDGEHFFEPNPINRFSIGTKNRDLKKNADGSLTIYLQHTSPGADKESNWLPVPKGDFSLLLRLYSPGQSVVKGEYMMPPVITIM